MNIFALDPNPHIAASMHCDQHVSKMILESAQMLSTIGIERSVHICRDIKLYKPTHHNHPCVNWLREKNANIDWLATLAHDLNTIRVLKSRERHASMDIIDIFYEMYPCYSWHSHTPFAMAMPSFIPGSTPVERYRRYYQYKHNTSFEMRWTLNNKPDWFSA